MTWNLKPYVTYLRDQGYYCTNNSKTDYNFKGNDAAIWDASSGKAHYQDRPADAPFMAVFNLTISHESNLFPDRVERNRRNGTIPPKPRLDPSEVTLPPYLPDLPEFRSDAAIYHDCISAMDRQVGALLDELEKRGLADDTIVFYYSDHGGAMARGKRYLQDTGTRVPMIVHIPEKWKDRSPFKAGDSVDEPVAFVDLAPTLLSLCGIPTPPQMQGRAAMRERLKKIMIETRDTGVVPEAMWPQLVKGGTIHEAVRADGFDHAKLVELAFLASTPAETLPPPVVEALASPSAVERYWAATAFRIAGKKNPKLRALSDDPSKVVRQAAREALNAP